MNISRDIITWNHKSKMTMNKNKKEIMFLEKDSVKKVDSVGVVVIRIVIDRKKA